MKRSRALQGAVKEVKLRRNNEGENGHEEQRHE